MARGDRAEVLVHGRSRWMVFRSLSQRGYWATGVDIGHAQALLDLIDGLRREFGTTVITTLHDLTFAAQYAERIVLLDRGTVALDGPPSEVLIPDALRDGYSARITAVAGPDGSPIIGAVREQRDS